MSAPVRTPAVVTALNVNGLAVARVLGRHRVPVIGIHENDTDPETRTRFAGELWKGDDGDPAALIALLLDKGPGFAEPPVLLPITDDAVTAVAHNLEALRRHYRVPMADPAVVLRLLDKSGFDATARELAPELGLALPATFTLQCAEDLERAAAGLPFPAILKPPTKSPAFAAAGGRKAVLIGDAAELRAAFERFHPVAPTLVAQQFVPGGDREVYFCLQCWGPGGEVLSSFTGRKLRQWRPLCGGTSACEPVVEPRIEEQTTRFFRAVGMVGTCSMEFKRDPRDGTYYLIEPTVCRPDWQNGLADANRVPIAWHAYLAALGEPVPPVRRPWFQRRWVDFGADRLSAHDYRQRGELGRLAWLWSIRPPVRGAYFALDDPRPFLTILSQWIRRRFGSGASKS